MENAALRKTIGKRIKTLRKLNRITQEELRKELGYKSTGMISQVENGIKGMSVDQIVATARRLNIHPAFLISDVDIDNEDLKMLMQLTVLMRKKGEHYKSIKTLLVASNV